MGILAVTVHQHNALDTLISYPYSNLQHFVPLKSYLVSSSNSALKCIGGILSQLLMTVPDNSATMLLGIYILSGAPAAVIAIVRLFFHAAVIVWIVGRLAVTVR